MATEAKAWVPEYESWRHGGWYVTNLHYPTGGCGCVSNNYPDKKWRIVADPTETTFPTRDAAARAEYVAVETARRTVAQCETESVKQLANVLRCFERDDVTDRREERPSGSGVLVFLTRVQAERIREAIGQDGN